MQSEQASERASEGGGAGERERRKREEREEDTLALRRVQTEISTNQEATEGCCCYARGARTQKMFVVRRQSPGIVVAPPLTLCTLELV